MQPGSHCGDSADASTRSGASSRSSSFTRAARDEAARRILSPGDMLYVRGEAGLLEIGAAGGWLGHVMLAISLPERIDKDDEEHLQYRRVWPAGAGEVWKVRAIESTRSAEGLHEGTYLFHASEGSYILIGEINYDTWTIEVSHENLVVWRAPAEVSQRLTSNIIERVVQEMREDCENWSWNTAVKAFGASIFTDLHHRDDESKEIVLDRMKRCWDQDPICTSVAISFLQRCLLELGEDEGLRLVLEYLPVMADRTLPGNLLNCMRDCGWSEQDMPEMSEDSDDDVAQGVHVPVEFVYARPPAFGLASVQPKRVPMRAQRAAVTPLKGAPQKGKANPIRTVSTVRGRPVPSPLQQKLQLQLRPVGSRQNITVRPMAIRPAAVRANAAVAAEDACAKIQCCPRYCNLHDETGKRPKAAGRVPPHCRKCKTLVPTTYAELAYCPMCSNEVGACMICGASAPPGRPRTQCSVAQTAWA